MAITVKVSGSGTFGGAESNLSSYSVTEESTPVAATDTSGAVGGLSFSAVDNPARLGSVLLFDSEVELTDGDRGTVPGIIDGLDSNDGLMSVSAVSRLNTLVTEKTAQYVNGTFDTAIRYYLSLGGVVDDVAVDASLSSIPIIAPGWKGDVWTKVKELCLTVGAEIAVLKGDVVVRPVRGRRALEINNSKVSWSIAKGSVAREIEVFYYDSQFLSNQMVYPYGGWNEDVAIYSVDAGETTKVNIPVDVSLSSITSPTPVDSVSRTHSTSSVYAVAGNDGHAIPAAMWTAYGGRLTARIGEDGQSIDLEITGASGDIQKYAPFRIAMSSGSSTYYSSLRIMGTGVGFDKQSVKVATGVDPDEIARDSTVSIDLPFIRTQADAFNVALDATAKWSAPDRTISIIKTDIRRPGETKEKYNYATFADFDELYDGQTFEDFDASFAGSTFNDFDQFWYGLVADDFDFQAFGNVGGSRLQHRRSMYRIRTATITESSVNFSAEADTTFGDFDTSAAGMTFSDFDTMYEGLSFAEFGLVPLANVEDQYDRL